MAKIVKRKCAKCKAEMKIDTSNINDVIWYNNAYYHKDCFIAEAQKKIEKKTRSYRQWENALNNIEEYERIAREKIGYGRPTDKLNDWLLEHYDIITTPSDRFWSIILDLGNGFYRNKRCRPVKVELLTEAWMWAQVNLDKIAMNNKQLGKDMEGEARLHYDLAIILKKLPLFVKSKEKQEAAKAEMANSTTFDNIDMSRIGQNKQITRRDVSDISDDLFVE